MFKNVYSIGEAALLLGVSVVTMRRWAASFQLAVPRFGAMPAIWARFHSMTPSVRRTVRNPAIAPGHGPASEHMVRGPKRIFGLISTLGLNQSVAPILKSVDAHGRLRQNSSRKTRCPDFWSRQQERYGATQKCRPRAGRQSERPSRASTRCACR